MSEQDDHARAREEVGKALQEVLRLMGFEATVQLADPGEREVLLRVESPEAAQLIGRKGQVLEALQFVLGRMSYRYGGRELRFTVDVGDYRARRKEQVLRDAAAAVEDVKRTGRPVKLPAMTAAERKLVHHLVAEQPGLETYSEPTEDEGRKRVVIRPAAEASPPPPAETL